MTSVREIGKSLEDPFFNTQNDATTSKAVLAMAKGVALCFGETRAARVVGKRWMNLFFQIQSLGMEKGRQVLENLNNLILEKGVITLQDARKQIKAISKESATKGETLRG